MHNVITELPPRSFGHHINISWDVECVFSQQVINHCVGFTGQVRDVRKLTSGSTLSDDELCRVGSIVGGGAHTTSDHHVVAGKDGEQCVGWWCR